MRRILFILAFTSATAFSFCQEGLINHSGYQPIKTQKKQTGSKSMLELPFFDDFARLTSTPTLQLWEPSNVITSSTFAANNPTIGFATFDAVNNKGVIYSHLTTTSLPADTLTSLPINLNYPATDSIYLSFSIEPGGLGYEPGPNDSLVLEFFSPSENKWFRSWAACVDFENDTISFYNHLNKTASGKKTAKLDSTFFPIIININNPDFLQSGFRFRFIGYASLMENATIPGYRTNSDQWHIDMVYLNRLRNWDDTIYNDIAFFKPLEPILTNYYSIPWNHFAEAESKEISSPRKFNIVYRNLGPTTWNVTRRFYIKNLSDNSEYTFSGGADNIYGYQNFPYTREYDYNFTSEWSDSAKFILRTWLITDNDEANKHLRYNDTLTQELNFYNYYALDDGSAESGYGLFGEGTLNAMVAQQFYNYKDDYLVGIMIYFNRSYQDANNIPFKITIWNDDNGKPGKIIYQKSITRPIFPDSLNQFSTFSTDKTFIPEGTFYVGWQQYSIDFINVGFDRNTNNQSKIFHSLPGYWTNTNFKGTIMIRPVFGKPYNSPTAINATRSSSTINIYPNPANYFFRIDIDKNLQALSYQIISTTGQVVASGSLTGDNLVSTSNLPTGIYIVRVRTNNGSVLTSKVIVR